MAGGFQQMREKAANAYSLLGGRPSLKDRYAERIARNEKKRAEEAEAARQAALEQQRINAQRERDKLLQKFEQANTGQRAMYAADAAANAYGYDMQLAKQQQRGQRERDKLQNRFDAEQASRQALEQELRDRRQFQMAQQEAATQFGNQLQRDAVQQGYTLDRDRFQNDATLQRDANQFGYQFLGDEFGQRRTLERDALQSRQQRERDKLLNEFGIQESERQFQNQIERDRLQNDFATQADVRQQGFNQENMYQREAAEISARWQEQIYQARNAGLDFSERQKREMQDLDASFRKNVLNGPYDEILKQRASVEHQKKLASIIPEERVQNPDEVLDQSVRQHQGTGEWFIQSRDSRGFPKFDPLVTGGSNTPKEDPSVVRKTQAQQKALFEREDKFRDLVRELQNELDPDTEERKYKTREDIMKAAMQEFAPYEQHYRQVYELPPLGPYQAEADRIRAEEERRQSTGQRVNPWRQMLDERQAWSMADSLRARSGDGMGSMPSQMPSQSVPVARQESQVGKAPVVISSSNFDDEIGKVSQSGDIETAAAMNAIRNIITKHGGPPPDGSEDKIIFGEAAAFLRAKGVSLQGKTRSQVSRAKPNVNRPHPGKL